MWLNIAGNFPWILQGMFPEYSRECSWILQGMFLNIAGNVPEYNDIIIKIFLFLFVRGSLWSWRHGASKWTRSMFFLTLFNSEIKLLYQLISTHRPVLKQSTVYMLTASNVALVVLFNDLLPFYWIIRNIRNFKKKNRILNHNIGRINRN